MPMTIGATVAVSAVIVTRNRPHLIGQAVASILKNDYDNFDLTIVDQSTSGATAEALAAMAGDSRLHYLHVDQAGVSRAYNTAIRSSRGEILAFTDDDCIVPEGWLRAIVVAFAQDPAADLLFGRVLPPRIPQIGGITPQLHIGQRERISRGARLRHGFRLLGGMGANFAVRRCVFARIGGFDELLGPGAPLVSGQDFDIAYRAVCAGSILLRTPDVHVVHQFGTRPAEEWSHRMRDYALGDAALYAKHVRSGDLFMLLLLGRWLVHWVGRPVLKGALHGSRPNLVYLPSFFRGVRQSLRYRVDAGARLYIAP
jgi:glycosyltransferase involved in cell wall biosynthesis